MDVVLPDMNGVEVTAILKRNPETSQIPIAILSASPVGLAGQYMGTEGLKGGRCKVLSETRFGFAIRETIEKFTSI
jgi:hypothetical protein